MGSTIFPFLSENTFILTALAPAILGAITIILTVAAIVRATLDKYIILEVCLDNKDSRDITKINDAATHLRRLSENATKTQLDQMSEERLTGTLVPDIITGLVGNANEALANVPNTKVVSLLPQPDEHKLVITLRTGSMSEKKAWSNIFAKSTAAKSNTAPSNNVDANNAANPSSSGTPIATSPKTVANAPTSKPFTHWHNAPGLLLGMHTRVTIPGASSIGNLILTNVADKLNTSIKHIQEVPPAKTSPDSSTAPVSKTLKDNVSISTPQIEKNDGSRRQ